MEKISKSVRNGILSLAISPAFVIDVDIWVRANKLNLTDKQIKDLEQIVYDNAKYTKDYVIDLYERYELKD